MANQFALVTGASSGCGYQYAIQLARRGYDLLIVSNEELIHQKAEDLRTKFPTAKVISLLLDLGTQEAAQQLYTYCTDNKLDIEVLINNAGVYHDCDFLSDSEKFNQLIINLHIYTPAMMIYYFGHQMASRGKGYILNMCSVTAGIPVQRLATYGASKAFLHNFSRSIYIEMKDKGVVVTNVSPGAIDTGLYNLKPWATKIGLALGYIVSPEHLVSRGLRAMFAGRSKVSVPCIWNYILLFIVALIPTSLLRLIRKLKLF